MAEDEKQSDPLKPFDVFARLIGNTVMLALFCWTAFMFGKAEGYHQGSLDMKETVFASFDAVVRKQAIKP